MYTGSSSAPAAPLPQQSMHCVTVAIHKITQGNVDREQETQPKWWQWL